MADHPPINLDEREFFRTLRRSAFRGARHVLRKPNERHICRDLASNVVDYVWRRKTIVNDPIKFGYVAGKRAAYSHLRKTYTERAHMEVVSQQRPHNVSQPSDMILMEGERASKIKSAIMLLNPDEIVYLSGRLIKLPMTKLSKLVDHINGTSLSVETHRAHFLKAKERFRLLLQDFKSL